MDCSMPGLPVLHQLLELAQTHVHWVGDAIQPSHPLLSPSPPALNLSQHRVFSDESALCIRRPKYWSFSIILSNEYSGLISFRIDWFDLLEVQGTQESSPTPQFKSISSSAYNLLYGPALTSMHDYWRNHSFNHMDLCRQSNISTFYTLSRCVIAFLPRRKHLNFMAAVTICSDLGAQGNSLSLFPLFPHVWSDGTGYHDTHFWMLSFHPVFSASSFTFIKRLFSSSSLSAIRVVSSAYLRLLIFLLAILIPACASSSLAFCMI